MVLFNILNLLADLLELAFNNDDLQVTLNGSGEYVSRLQMDLDLAKQYRRLLQELKSRLNLSGDIDLALLTHFRNIINVTEKPMGSQRVTRVFQRLFDEALDRLERMRRREGRELR